MQTDYKTPTGNIEELQKALYERLDKLEREKVKSEERARILSEKIVQAPKEKKRRKLERMLDQVQANIREIEFALTKLQLAVKEVRESLRLSKIILDMVNA